MIPLETPEEDPRTDEEPELEEVASEEAGSGGADSPEEVVGDEDEPAATPEQAEERQERE